MPLIGYGEKQIGARAWFRVPVNQIENPLRLLATDIVGG